MAQDWFSVNAPKANPSSGDWFAANAPKRETPAPSKPTPPKNWLDRPTGPEDFPVYNMAKGAWNVISGIPSALFGERGMVTNLAGAVKGAGEAQGQVYDQAKQALDRGDYFRATVKGVEYLIPILGPAMSAAGDKMEQGDVAEGIGEIATTAALTAAPFRPTPAKPPLLKGPANAKDAAAVNFARQRNVPLDAGTATGSNFIKTVQEKAGNTYGGARTAEALKGQQADALARVGGELMDDAAPRATNPVAAGEAVKTTLTKQIQDLNSRASGHYDALRALEEAQRANLPKDPAVLATMDVTARTPLAVDVSAALKQLQPMYQQLMRESQLGIPMQGGKGRMLAALDGLMNGPNVASLSTVDAALSDLKAMARGADMPELRTSGQASAAQAVQKLDAQVRAAAAKAGPHVLRSLEQGRAATKQKYATADVLEMLSGEPGQIYRQLTQAKDVGLERLKAVQRLAPQEMPNVGRAFLEDLMQQATSEGGFAHTDRLWANWQKLGTESKKTMFPKKGQIQALDNFFLLGKRINEIKNPSGTAKVAGVLDLATGIPAWALSKMLMTPDGVRYLTTARLAGKSSAAPARALAVAHITKAAQSAGIPLEAIPALGEERRRSTPTGRVQ